MPAVTSMKNQINCLESGLKTLKESQLKAVPEFQDMYVAIEKHHRDIKLAHLTGKAKDLLQQAEQDTKFYYILVNMLRELENDHQHEQKGHLSKVYDWYKKNQHVLHTKPHFGKKKHKDPRSILKNSYGKLRRDSDSICLAMTPTHKKQSGHKTNSQTNGSDKPDLEVPTYLEESQSDIVSTDSKKIEAHQSKASTPKKLVQEKKDSDFSQLLPKRKALPLSALYNPHGRDMDVVTNVTPLEHNSPVRIRVGPSVEMSDGNGEPGSMEQRIYQMRKWDAFQQEQSYGQDLLSKMQHVGRTGAPGGVRYTAHENGLMAEDYTQDVISAYSVIQDAKKQLLPTKDKTPDSKMLTNQTLEQFYELADNYYPPNRPKYPSFCKSRIQSAPSGSRKQQQSPEARKRSMSAKLCSAEDLKRSDSEETLQSSVKLEAIVGMIDTVSDEMSHFKEKLVPHPQPGFRQPVAEIDPSERPITAPVGAIARPASPEEKEPHFAQQVVEAVDWRGKVVPDAVNYRYGQPEAFNGHSYLQKMPGNKGSLRTVGKTHGGSRPKTAPMTPREKWATEKPSDENERAISQAASHVDTEVKREATDSLLQIQHLGGKSRRRRRRQMLMNFDWADQEFQRFGPTSPSVNMEFVSFITPKSMMGSRATSAARSTRMESGLTGTYSPAAYSMTASDQIGYDNQVPDYVTESEYVTHPDIDSMTGELDLPDIHDLDDEIGDGQGSEWLGDQQEPCQYEPNTPVQSEVTTCVEQPQDNPLSEPASGDYQQYDEASSNRRLLDEINALVSVPSHPLPEGDPVLTLELPGSMEPVPKLRARSVTINPEPCITPIPGPEGPLLDQVTSHLDLVVRTGGRPTTVPAGAGRDRRERAIAQAEKACNLPTAMEPGPPISPRHRVYQRTFPKPDLQPETSPSLAIEGKSTNNRNAMRSAGRAPARAKSANRHEMIMKQNEMLKKAASPHRTAPSIPRAFQPFGSRSASSGKTYMPEMEVHARKDRSPRHLMEKVNILRAEEIEVPEPEISEQIADGQALSTSLKVQRLRPSAPDRALHSPSLTNMPVTPAPSEEASYHGLSERIVIGAEADESPGELKQRSIEIGSGLNKKIIHMGRPIPRYGKVEDPDEYAAAVALQKETQAAVDIQRIFRGYVSRNRYKYLVREEREKMENQQMAAIEIQRRFRGHLLRKKAISNRNPSQESIQWAKEYKLHLAGRQEERDLKVQSRTYENAKHKHVADTKIAVIGPHVEVYANFHPKKTEIDKSILEAAATAIQRKVRGWLVRIKFQRLKRKSKQHARSWGQFIGQYKELMFRIQTRMGVEKPKFYFSFDHIDAFMDTRKRYESVFDKKSFSNELDVHELPEYFRECDLYPAQAEIDEAMDALFRGQPIKKGRGLYKHEVLEITCSIYPPKGSGIVHSRKSTWMHPIIDGEEALKLLGTENVEPADFKTCWKLVSETKKAKNKQKLIDEEKAREDAWQKRHGKNKKSEPESKGQDLLTQSVSMETSASQEESPPCRVEGDGGRESLEAQIEDTATDVMGKETVSKPSQELEKSDTNSNMVFGQMKLSKSGV